MNKVKDSVAVPDHEGEEKEIGMEKVRQEKATFFFLNKIQLFILIFINRSTSINYIAMNQDQYKDIAFGL